MICRGAINLLANNVERRIAVEVASSPYHLLHQRRLACNGSALPYCGSR
jgi:hypothetical protein